MSLAVIIPNYNKEKYITKCIESVFAQTLQPTEVIVVDDCSTDSSIIILEELKAHFDTLKIIPLKKNQGVSNARNVGVSISTSDYITFLDSDDYYYNEKKLENEMKLIDQFGYNTVAYSYTAKINEDGELIRTRMGTFRYPEGMTKNKLIANYRYCSGMPRDYCLSKNLFCEVGGYTVGKNLYEDLELTIKLAKTGCVLRNTKQIGTAYRAVSTGLSVQKEEKLRKALREILNSYYRKEGWLNRRQIDCLRIVTLIYRGFEFVERKIGRDPEGR